VLRVGLGVTLAVALAAGCSGASSGGSPVAAVDYGNGMQLELLETSEGSSSGTRSGDASRTVVLMVHGCCGDRRDMATFGRALAAHGALVANADVHAFRDGGGWPQTYLDAVCAYAWTRRLADDSGARIAVLGWDDGALVLATVALGWEQLARDAVDCAVPPPSAGPELVIGVAGHYGWVGDPPIVTEGLIEWFGGSPEAEPAAWSQGNPGWWLAQEEPTARPRFVLVGGADDEATSAFGSELTRRGFDADVEVFDDVDHLNAIQPRVGPGVQVLDALVDLLELAEPDR
jgi:hypothetical protein